MIQNENTRSEVTQLSSSSSDDATQGKKKMRYLSFSEVAKIALHLEKNRKKIHNRKSIDQVLADIEKSLGIKEPSKAPVVGMLKDMDIQTVKSTKRSHAPVPPKARATAMRDADLAAAMFELAQAIEYTFRDHTKQSLLDIMERGQACEIQNAKSAANKENA